MRERTAHYKMMCKQETNEVTRCDTQAQLEFKVRTRNRSKIELSPLAEAAHAACHLLDGRGGAVDGCISSTPHSVNQFFHNMCRPCLPVPPAGE